MGTRMGAHLCVTSNKNKVRTGDRLVQQKSVDKVELAVVLLR